MMLDRETALTRFQGMSEGTPVFTRDDERLGKITHLEDDSFTVEKGIFFPKDFVIRYDDIQDIQDNGIHLSLAKNELSEWKDASYQGWSQVDDVNQGRLNARPLDQYKDRYQDRYQEQSSAQMAGSKDQVRMPVAEEELQATKTVNEAGRLKVRKLVHTELRHFTIPVMKEEVRVERVKASEGQTATPTGTPAFQEQTVDIPIMEEEISVAKRPVVKEEVRISKERLTEERPVSGEIRKEEVRIEGEEALKRKKAA